MNKIFLFITILFLSHQIFNEEKNQSLGKKSKKLKIHMIPHSHDDVGWLKTPEDYYYGFKNNIQWAGVRYIISSVVNALLEDSKRKFIQVEIYFFEKWWNDQNDVMKQKVRHLVFETKQLKFVLGGYVMNDESDAYYEDIVDQMTVGHEFLKRVFGIAPETAWHIDPFGHTHVQARLFSQMGFKFFAIARIHYQDKEQREIKNTMENLWFPQGSVKHPIFGHVTYDNYAWPRGFDQDRMFTEDPIAPSNVEQKAQQFVEYFEEMSQKYKYPILMHTAGEDFEYAVAQSNYQNLEYLSNYINQNYPNITITQSHPSDYFNEINQYHLSHQGDKLPVEQHDYMPYADKRYSYWTGYYTSRFIEKHIIKKTGRELQIIRNFLTRNLKCYNIQNYEESLSNLEKQQAINQHHDAVTGTEKQFVADDYMVKLEESRQAMYKNTLFQAVQDKTQSEIGQQVKIKQNNKDNLNQSFKDQKNFIIVLINESGHDQNDSYQINSLNDIHYSVNNFALYDQDQQLLQQELFLDQDNNTSTINFKLNNQKKYAQNYVYVKFNGKDSINISKGKQIQYGEDIRVSESQNLQYISSGLFQYKFNDNIQYFQINHKFLYGKQNDNEQNSGAYIFRSQNDNELPMDYNNGDIKAVLYYGKLSSQITLIRKNFKTKIQLFNNNPYHIDVYNHIYPIDVSNNKGKEIIVEFKFYESQDQVFDNKDEFYLDSNGLDLIKRKLNYQPSFDLVQTQPITGNFYPANPTIQIRNNKNQKISVLNDRVQAASSLQPGTIQFLVNRRLLQDDWRGVNEALNEKDESGQGIQGTVKHTIVFGNSYRQIQQQQDQQQLIFLGDESQVTQKQAKLNGKELQFDFLKDKDIKYYVRLYSGKYYLRLQNFNEFQTKSVKVQAKELEELSISLNQSVSEIYKNKLHWNVEQNDNNQPDNKKVVKIGDNYIVQLNPLEIRAFYFEQLL